jgi:GNAT superfamily N-acetyltransferase
LPAFALAATLDQRRLAGRQGAVSAVRWNGPDGYWVSDDKSLIEPERVHHWMSKESYWAAGRRYEVMQRAIENSLVLGLYAPDGTQAGFARLVTDYSTFAWLCDVFVADEHRGRGIGSFLVEKAVDHPDVAGIRQVLATRPGRTLYQRHGYVSLLSPERWMERSSQNAPDRAAAIADRDSAS